MFKAPFGRLGYLAKRSRANDGSVAREGMRR